VAAAGELHPGHAQLRPAPRAARPQRGHVPPRLGL
jgi:hypothetical protein